MTGISKKLKARDAFVHFAEELTKQKVQNLNQVQQSFALTRFYISEIRNCLRAEISDEDLDLAIVDGSNDLDCDLIHRDDKQVLILQARYRGHGQKEPADKISHFQGVLKRLADPQVKVNARLQDQLSQIDWKNDTFELVYVTFGNIDHQARKVSEQPANYPEQIPGLEQRCVWTYHDETNLNEELRSAHALAGQISDKSIVLYPVGQKGNRGNSIIEIVAGEHRSFILALDARQMVRAYQELSRDALFSLNIRNYIGNTSTNAAIITSAQQRPDQFFLFNNGISCLCNKLTAHDDRIEVSGLQVINGAQTVKALVRAGTHRPGKPDPWAIDVPRILVRITELPGGYGSSGRIRDEITQFNNTQNTIKDSDFRSNDPVQLHLKDQFSELWRRGRQVRYLPKRTDLTPKNSEVVRLEEFAKSAYAFLSDPTAFSGATAFLFNDDPQTGGYNLVFGDGETKWDRMPTPEFRIRAAIYWIAQDLTSQIKKDRSNESDADTRAALERKWMVLFAVRKVLEFYFPGDAWKQEIQKFYKGDWELGVGAKGELLLKIYKDANKRDIEVISID